MSEGLSLVSGQRVGERAGHGIAHRAISVECRLSDIRGVVKIPVNLAIGLVGYIDAEHGMGRISLYAARNSKLFKGRFAGLVITPNEQVSSNP